MTKKNMQPTHIKYQGKSVAGNGSLVGIPTLATEVTVLDVLLGIIPSNGHDNNFYSAKTCGAIGALKKLWNLRAS